jgi:hypothetical protein
VIVTRRVVNTTPLDVINEIGPDRAAAERADPARNRDRARESSEPVAVMMRERPRHVRVTGTAR